MGLAWQKFPALAVEQTYVRQSFSLQFHRAGIVSLQSK